MLERRLWLLLIDEVDLPCLFNIIFPFISHLSRLGPHPVTWAHLLCFLGSTVSNHVQSRMAAKWTLLHTLSSRWNSVEKRGVQKRGEDKGKLRSKVNWPWKLDELVASSSFSCFFLLQTNCLSVFLFFPSTTVSTSAHSLLFHSLPWTAPLTLVQMAQRVSFPLSSVI